MFVLSKDDRDVLVQVVRWWKKRTSNAGRGGGADQRDHEEFPAPEVYVAFGGVPKRSGSTPGTAECDIYEIQLTNGEADNPTLVPVTPLSQRVYNVSIRDIPDETYSPTWRDKFGRWLVGGGGGGDEDEPGTGTQSYSSCESLAKIKTSDCVVVRTGIRDYILEHDGAGWTSDEIFTPPGGSGGVFRFEWNGNTGFADLKLGGTRLLNCGSGCYSGGPLTGHAGQADNNCSGVAWTVCVECSCCPDPAWDGPAWYCVKTGVGEGTAFELCEPLFVTAALACDVEICSGPYASYAEAAAVCIPPVTAPCQTVGMSTAVLTLSSKTGDCACLETNPARIFDGIDTVSWVDGDSVCTPPCDPPPGECQLNAFDLNCVDGFYELTMNGVSGTVVSFTASPFELVVDFATTTGQFCFDTPSTGTGSVRATVTIP